MLILLFAMMALWSTDAPRLLPSIPEARPPWMETGNRHARRRMAKVGF